MMPKGFVEAVATAELSPRPADEKDRGLLVADGSVAERDDVESIIIGSSDGSDSRNSRAAEQSHYEQCHDYASITCLPAAKRDGTKVIDTSTTTTTARGSLLINTSGCVENKGDEVTGEPVANHVTYEKQSGNDNEHQETEQVDLATEEDYCYTTGENTRCNCSGRRRATLAGLIELFEQKVHVEDPSSNCCSRAGEAATRLPLVSKSRTKTISNLNVNRTTNNNNKSEQMRNIITPVKYQLSETDETDEEEEEGESEQETANLTRQSSTRLAGNSSRDNRSTEAASHHVAIKGVPVLPQSRKLTATNWQPATDGRQYDRPRSGQKTREQQSVAEDYLQTPSKRIAGTRKISSGFLAATRGPSIVKHQASSSRRLLSQLARLRRLDEPNYRVKRPEKVAQVESLIDQLERATVEWEEDDYLFDRAERRDRSQQHQQLFPETPNERAETIHVIDFGCRNDVNPLEENAIARSHSMLSMKQQSLHMDQQLHDNQVRYRAAGSWSSSLGRPAQASRHGVLSNRYYDDLAVRKLSSNSPSVRQSRLSLTPDAQTEMQVNFSSGHQMSYLLCSNAYTPAIDDADWDILDRRVRLDDLHYRNIKNKPDPHEPPFGIPRQPALAGTHSSASHYLRRQMNEPTASPSPTCRCSCSCAQHQPQQHQQVAYRNNLQAAQKRADSRVSFVDRTSISDNHGYASNDSGVAGGGTPVSLGERQSTLYRATPSSPLDVARSTKTRSTQENLVKQHQRSDFEYADTEEVDLDLNLDETGQVGLEELKSQWSPCESPALERYMAQIRATPVKRRPMINIENPRSKSPLLRAAKRIVTPSTSTERPTSQDIIQVQCYGDTNRNCSPPTRQISELECHYNFNDDDDELEQPKARKIVTTNLDSGDSSPNESSIERYNYRGQNRTIRSGLPDERSNTEKNIKKPLFSIGEYKPLNRPNLKVL